MGDSETVIAQTSAVMGYTASAYASNYVNVGSTSLPDSTATVAAASDGASLGDGNTYDMSNVDAIMQEATSSKMHESRPLANDESKNSAKSGIPAMGPSEDVEYSSVNGNIASESGNDTSAGNGGNGGPSDDAGGETAQQQSEEALSSEEERLWSIVRANSLDFNAWTALIEETEKIAEDNILKIRKVYDAFLVEFPLCYGYWKKYADHESRLGSIEKVVEVYERAVQGVTYSVDIWLHYCIFAISTYGDPDTIRRLFERGLAYVGTDYLSYPLWDKFIEYEYSQQEWARLAVIYTRILENPNQQLDRYLNSFKELAGSRPLSELKTAEEAAIEPGVTLEDVARLTEGEVHPDEVDPSPKPISEGSSEAEELEKYVAVREEMYKKAKEFDAKVIGFETAIRRPYFHVRPLNVAELENWHNYLDFIEREGDLNKVVKLYERCLIACANYPEYWIRYVLSMEASGSMDIANNALVRATQVFVKRQPEIHLFAARFKEQNEDIDGARAAYQLVHTGVSPGLLEAIIKHANMEHRLGNLETAASLYEQAIAIEKGKEQSQTLPLLFAQYSRFLYLVSGNAEKAREILDEALQHVQPSKPLLEALIHLESIQPLPKRIDYLDSLVDNFVVPNPDSHSTASAADREELSSIFLEFLDLFGDVQSIKKADDRHAKFFLPHRSTSETKKRHADDYLSSDKSKLVKSSPAQSVMGAYPSSQNLWPAGYGLQPQTWPQVTQAPGQHWNPAYAQQAGYSAYSGYGGSYTQPQVSTSNPQTAAYVSYPPTYPPQAFPQQSYAQPATAGAIASTQQPTSAPQAYYGNYF